MKRADNRAGSASDAGTNAIRGCMHTWFSCKVETYSDSERTAPGRAPRLTKWAHIRGRLG